MSGSRRGLQIWMVLLLLLVGAMTTATPPETVSANHSPARPEGFILPIKRDIPFRIEQGPRCSGYVAATDTNLTHNAKQPYPERNKEALDIGMPVGTEVYAAQAGKVTHGSTPGELYIHHNTNDPDNGLRSIYAHLSERYRNGDTVSQGELIGKSGDVNAPDDPHLHYAVVNVVNGVETAVPIYQMLGLIWNPRADNYPSPSGSCPTNGLADGRVQYPPKPCGNYSVGANTSFELKFVEAFIRYNERWTPWVRVNNQYYPDMTPDNRVGCAENATHDAGEIVGGENFALRVQDFVKDGDYHVIIHDQIPVAGAAYVLVGPFRDKYFSIHEWWRTLGAPTGDEDQTNGSADPHDTDRSAWRFQQFQRGQIYHRDSVGTFVSYGRVYEHYYGMDGTRSFLGHPKADVVFEPGKTYQEFEGGSITCRDGQACVASTDHVCNFDTLASTPSGVTVASVFDMLTGVSIAHAQSSQCDPVTNPDRIAPHLGVTDLRGTAVNTFRPRVQVLDNDASISWVQFHYKVPGGNFTAVNMTLVPGTTDQWETSLNTLGYSNGQVIEYLFWASDSAGNAAQISGLYTVPVQNDQAIPTIAAIDLPSVVDGTLSVNVRVEDANPVTWVTLHVRPQGGGFVQVPMTYNGDSWIATYDSSGFNTGQVLEYLFWAQDEPGNVGQISGLYQATVQDLTQPRGMVSLTFDDGFESVYTEALPVLSQYNMPGVAYVTTGWTGTTGYLSWSQIQTLQNSHGWEIGGHSVTHAELPAISEAAMIDEVVNSKQALTSHGLSTTTFATPFGSYNSPTVRELAKIYEGHRGFWDRDNFNVYPYDRYWIQVRSVDQGVSVQQVLNWIDLAMVRGEWLVLVFHDIADVPDPEDAYAVSTANLQTIAQHLSQQQIPVRTVQQALRRFEEVQVNLFPNSQFQSGIAGGWTTDKPTQVTSDSGTHGVYPQPQHSVKFVGGTQASHLFSPQLPVDAALTYLFKAFVNTEGLTGGEFGFYVDEYNSAGNWISGQWLGAASFDRVREYVYTYKPSSSTVKKLRWQFYMDAGSTGTVYLDGVHLSVQDNVVKNSSFEALENGWVLNWTGDTNYLVVNTQSQGSNGTNSVIFPANPPSTKYLFSELLPVNPSLTYYWRSFVKSSTAGNEFGFYIDEYDAAGNWISGQWKGNITTSFNGWKQYVYTPTSGSVAKVRLQYYLLAASAQKITLDQVSFTNQGDLNAPTGSIVNPPATVDEELALRVDADDDSGVEWIEVVFYLDGEYYDELFLTYNGTSGLWEVDYPTDYIDDGSELEVDIWIADPFGNELNLNHVTTIQH